jgi:hypothetical protein
MDEVVKRVPTFRTPRDLFVCSGNGCALPGYDRVRANHKGQWVSEVCPIEVALPGGERF